MMNFDVHFKCTNNLVIQNTSSRGLQSVLETKQFVLVCHSTSYFEEQPILSTKHSVPLTTEPLLDWCLNDSVAHSAVAFSVRPFICACGIPYIDRKTSYPSQQVGKPHLTWLSTGAIKAIKSFLFTAAGFQSFGEVFQPMGLELGYRYWWVPDLAYTEGCKHPTVQSSQLCE